MLVKPPTPLGGMRRPPGGEQPERKGPTALTSTVFISSVCLSGRDLSWGINPFHHLVLACSHRRNALLLAAGRSPVMWCCSRLAKSFSSSKDNDTSFEHGVGVSQANRRETRKLGLLPPGKRPKSNASKWSRWSVKSVFVGIFRHGYSSQ